MDENYREWAAERRADRIAQVKLLLLSAALLGLGWLLWPVFTAFLWAWVLWIPLVIGVWFLGLLFG